MTPDASPKITLDVYAHALDDDLERAADVLDRRRAETNFPQRSPTTASEAAPVLDMKTGKAL